MTSSPVAIHYTALHAALHESGHTAVALALELAIDHVELTLVPGGNEGWRGHCVLVGDGPVNARFAAFDAFALAGPICQLIVEPESLDGQVGVFQPSLFAKIHEHFADHGAVINHLRWQDDLISSGVIYVAPGAPRQQLAELKYGAKPWLLELDKLLRDLFGRPEVRTFVNALAAELIAAPGKRLMPARLEEHHHATVPVGATQPLRDFVAAQPDCAPAKLLAIPPLNQPARPNDGRPPDR